MNINILISYVIFVECNLNFTEAAKRFHVSQPAMSKNIKKLQMIVGDDLFIKRGKVYISLTSRGEDVLFFSKAISSLFNEMKS